MLMGPEPSAVIQTEGQISALNAIYHQGTQGETDQRSYMSCKEYIQFASPWQDIGKPHESRLLRDIK